MTTLGIIGSGLIGGTVARLSVAAGYHVVLSNSRGPETLAELAAELSVPVKAFGELPVKSLAGKTVMDTPSPTRQAPPAPAAKIHIALVGAHR